MMGFETKELKRNFLDENACLEWLKNAKYPRGIICSACGKVTKHHKVSGRRCYACDYCGSQVYPTSGTIFHKSTIPLKTWYKVIYTMDRKSYAISAGDLVREFDLSYKSAGRMIIKVREFLAENKAFTKSEVSEEKTETEIYNAQEHPENRRIIFQKRDRTARLLKIQMLLSQNPDGMNIDDISSKCAISKRTAYRDLNALEVELGVPIWEDGNKRGIDEGYFLSPITLTSAEATIVFLAARLVQNYSHLNNPGLTSTFMKLNSIVPMPLKKEIQNTLEYLEKQPKDVRKISNFSKLIQAWLSQNKVKIFCQYIGEEKPVERVIDPYFIEPSIIGSSSYVIAYCHLKKTICAFKLERIIGEVQILSEKYKIPADFNTINYLGEAWGIQTDQPVETVRLHFSPKVSRIVAEFNVHPTQTIQFQDDGSMIMKLKVRDSIHFLNWIIAWADEVEVLEPESMKNQIREIARSLLNKYPEPERVGGEK